MLSNIWNTVFFYPIMNTLLLVYSFLGNNLGFSIIVITIVLRLLIFPLMKNQLESSKKLKEIQPKLEKIQKKYEKNPQKAQEEQIKLYKKVGYNPVGCFVSTLAPFPFLAAIYQSIKAFSTEGVTGIYDFVRDIIGGNGDISINTDFFGLDLSQSLMPLIKDKGILSWEVIPYLVLAVLAALSQFALVKINSDRRKTKKERQKEKEDKKKSKKDKKKKDKEPDQMDMMKEMTKSMKYYFPIMTFIAGLSLPAAVAIYWNVQSWMSIGLQEIYYKFISKDK